MPQQPERFEVLVLGSGVGGKLTAWHLARSGQRTAVVERRWIGGACPNIACMPSKNEIRSAKVAHLARHGGGIRHDDRFGRGRYGDGTPAQARDGRASGREALGELQSERRRTDHGERALCSAENARSEREWRRNARNDGRKGLPQRRNARRHSERSRPGAARPLTHIEALELDYLPPHLIVIGGGYSGLELAQAYRRFGSDVTIIESGPQLMGREDIDVSKRSGGSLRGEGIQAHVTAELLNVRGRSGDKVSLQVRTPSGEQKIEGSDILVAAGRIPNTAGIGLEQAGVKVDSRGYIRVNERLETTAAGIWALGECAGSPQFTHVSEDDFRIIRDNLAEEIAARATD